MIAIGRSPFHILHADDRDLADVGMLREDVLDLRQTGL
jgi:hypothetical protein